MRPRGRGPSDPFTTTERILLAFRMPRELVSFLKAEAQASGRDLTSYVNRMLEGVRTWFGLPVMATQYLEADRVALKMHRYEYLLHVLFLRSLQVRDSGPGFDAPEVRERKKR